MEKKVGFGGPASDFRRHAVGSIDGKKIDRRKSDGIFFHYSVSHELSDGWTDEIRPAGRWAPGAKREEVGTHTMVYGMHAVTTYDTDTSSS